MDLVQVALEIAKEAHRGQVDKIGQPYILHPIAVAEALDTPELKVVGLLHNVIEDSPITAQNLIARGIPADLVEVVEAITKKQGENYEHYIRRVKENEFARRVKLADLAHNMAPERADGLDERRKRKYELAKEILTED